MRVGTLRVLCLLAGGCVPDRPAADEAGEAPAAGGEASTHQVTDATAAFGEGTRSLRVKRSIVVRAAADAEAAPLGTVAQDMRVGWTRVAQGPGCTRWVEIQPEGWICERYLEPNVRAPRTVELPRLAEDSATPATYGKVRGPKPRAFSSAADASTGRRARFIREALYVRHHSELSMGRRSFWRTGAGELIDARSVRPLAPSDFEGVELTGRHAPLLPFAWTRGWTPVFEETRRWVEHPPLPPRSVVPWLRLSRDGQMVRLGESRWVAADALRVARLTEPPADLDPDERWIDVDLDQQVLVAYQGHRPVFATLVSSGAAQNPTPEGEFRIWIKFSEADMKGVAQGRPYTVQAVPWVMFFQGDFALHTAYWHDRFGETASSGCVNLSPRDARRLYQWTQPAVHPGWTMGHATPERPGTRIRLRRDLPGAMAQR